MNSHLLLANILSNPWFELLVVGVIVGMILSAVMRGKAFGFWGNLLVGVVGAIIGGFIWDQLLSNYISFQLGSIEINLNQVVVALLGAFLFILILNFIKRRKNE